MFGRVIWSNFAYRTHCFWCPASVDNRFILDLLLLFKFLDMQVQHLVLISVFLQQTLQLIVLQQIKNCIRDGRPILPGFQPSRRQIRARSTSVLHFWHRGLLFGTFFLSSGDSFRRDVGNKPRLNLLLRCQSYQKSDHCS